MTDQAIDAGATRAPIFIHSLFRAGSTYVFNAFRRLGDGYRCYQEPLHEISLYAKDSPELLLSENTETMDLLRHPKLKDPYFFELYQVSDRCLDKLAKREIYDAYFALGGDAFGVDFWRSLIDASDGRVVIQECRTSSRIGAIKHVIGGFHIYLWRNPWDQWWSYKVADYFDATSQLFVNAAHRPPVIERLRQEIAFSGFESDDLAVQIEWFLKRRLAPEQSYLIFYVLWLHGLREAVTQADLLLNVDRLSDSAQYRSEITSALSASGVDGLDFADCAIPQTCYGAGDREFFARIEDKAHGLLLLSGTTQRELDELLALRRNAEPLIWHECAGRATRSGIIRDADRARALVLTAERREVGLRSSFAQRCEALEQRALAAEARGEEMERLLEEHLRRALAAEASTREEEQRATLADARADGLEQQAGDNLRRAIVAEAEAAEHEYRAGLAEAFIEELELRVLEAETRAVGLEACAGDAVAGDAKHVFRAPVSEIQLGELKRRVVAALMQVNELQQRAITAETRIGELEYQVFAAEGRTEESERRAVAAEAEASAHENRAVLAEARAQELQTLVVAIETQVTELEQRATVAEELEQHAAAVAARAAVQEGRAVRAEEHVAELQNQLGVAECRSDELARRAAAAEAAVGEMESRLATVEAHWQQETSLVGALQAERDELQRAVAAAQGSVHYWRLESVQWHERLLTVHRSNSWRITAPVRAVKRVVTGDFSPFRRAAGLVTNGIRKALRPSAVAAAHVALSHPRLRYKVSTTLRKYPALRQHAILFVRNAGLMGEAVTVIPQANPLSVSHESNPSRSLVEADQSYMSAAAWQIYANIKAAIEQNKRHN